MKSEGGKGVLTFEIFCGIIILLRMFDKSESKGNVKMINNIVTVTVDRPLGTYHPEYNNMYYPINYGHIEGITAPDGEEQDAYILGVNEPVEKFTGKIIAIVHRFDDVEDKWVVCPENIFWLSPNFSGKVI